MSCSRGMRFTAYFSLLLSLSLSLFPGLPCYTLAYADESREVSNGLSDFGGAAKGQKAQEAQEDSFIGASSGYGAGFSSLLVADSAYDNHDCLRKSVDSESCLLAPSRVVSDDVLQQNQKEISDGSAGFDQLPFGAQSPVDGTDGSPATDGYSNSDGAAEGTGQDSSGDYGRRLLDGDVQLSTRLSGVSPDSVPGLERDSPALDSYSADSDSSGVEEISPLADARASTLNPIDALVAQAWSGSTSEWTIGNIKFKALNGTIFWLVSILTFKVDAIYGESAKANNYLRAIDTAVKSSAESNSDSSLYLYHIRTDVSATATILNNALYAKNQAGNPVSIAGYLSAMSPYMVTIQRALDDMNGLYLYHIRGDVTAATTILNNALYANNQAGNPVSVAGYLSAMSPYMVTIQKALDQANAYTVADSSLLSRGFDDLRKALYANNQAGNAVSVAGYLSAMSPYMVTIDQKLGVLSQIRSDLEASNSSGTLLSVAQYLSTMSPLLGDIGSATDEIRLFTSRHVLAVPEEYQPFTLWDLLYSIFSLLQSSIGFNGDLHSLLFGLQESITSWANSWDSQDRWLIEWAKRWDALDKGDVDLSETNKLLGLLAADVERIRDLIVLNKSKDFVDTLLGDLDFTSLTALSSEVEKAISSSFPFCIPAILKHVLGLMAADGSAPVWTFYVQGEPLVCDFSPFQSVADVTGWVVRIGFTLVLLANTRRFVFMGGGVVSE